MAANPLPLDVVQPSIEKLPLCVDCDGTLVKTDLLHESVFMLMKRSVLFLFLLPLWLLRGKAYCKTQIARRADIDVALLPYNLPLVEYLREASSQGRHLILATAAARKYAEQIAGHLGIFHDVIATDGRGPNLSGSVKAARLTEMFGSKGFVYAGNSRTDVPVWRSAAAAVLVNAPQAVTARASQHCPIANAFPPTAPRATDYLAALRLHQWLKNVLVFLPVLAAHKAHDVGTLIAGTQAFVAYGLCASAVYLLNDLLDLPSDRAHATKKHRPFAAGVIPIWHGVLLVPAALALVVAVSALLPPMFLAVLVGYFATSTAYSLWLKSKVVVDVLTLAGLYTFRIIAGAVATGIALSFWLLAFSLFLFFSLALVKRCAELLSVARPAKGKAPGRGYRLNDLPLLLNFGTSSGLLAALVVALYVHSDDVQLLYSHPAVLWLVLPVVLYWISRIWMKTHRGEMHGDPVVFAVRDRISLCAAGLIAAILGLASGALDPYVPTTGFQ